MTQDEIGELAIAFNQMRKQLKFNMNALSQEKEHLSSILSSMADGVITFNKDGTILETNPPAERFLQSLYFEKGYNREDNVNVPLVLMNLLMNQSPSIRSKSVKLLCRAVIGDSLSVRYIQMPTIFGERWPSYGI